MRENVKRFISLVLSAALIVGLMQVMPSEKVDARESGFDIGVVNFDADLTSINAENENLIKMERYIHDAYEAGDEILVFPEYSLTSKKEDAIDVKTNDSVDAISKLADKYDMYILFGAMIIDDEKYYSAEVICDPDGKVDTYEKTHLTNEEYKNGLSVGDTPYVLTTEYGNFGIALGQEFAEVAELGKYYYGSAVRMILVSQSYGYDTTKEKALSQAEYDLYTATYAYVRMYSRSVAVANLYTEDGSTSYFGESHVCTNYISGWIAGCDGGVEPVTTENAGVVSGTVSENRNDTGNGMSSRRLNQLADWYGKIKDYQLPEYGAESKYKDDVKVASVNFHPVWGNLDTNVKLMEDIMDKAYEDGVELLVFPEMALTGYDVVVPDSYDDELKAKFGDDYMQHVLSQVVRGEHPSEIITELQKKAADYDMYILFGLPEQDETDADLCWNSVAILGPDLIQSYRKVNLAFPEPNWAAYSTENDGIFETPFGYVGVGICADIYNYQELQRTYAEMGCRIVVNCTAGAASTDCFDGSWQKTYQNRLESFMLRDKNFMITSNLVGYEGPVTEAVTSLLSEYGYSADDMDTTWMADTEKTNIFNEVTELYSLKTKTEEIVSGSVPAVTINSTARTYIFPGASVCIGLDESTDTGTYVFGNYTSSGVTSDGTKNPYMNITPDTFNQYYGGEFDLSKATLEHFYNENPWDYRPELYYKWYSELFYNTYGFEVGEVSYEDKASGVAISADKEMKEVKFNIAVTASEPTAYAMDGYDIMSATVYDITSNAALTTSYNKRTHTDTNGQTTKIETADYAGVYATYLGKVIVSVPIGYTGADKIVIYSSTGNMDVASDSISADIEMTSDDIVTVVAYKTTEVKAEPTQIPVTATPAVTKPVVVTNAPTPTEKAKKISVGKATIKSAVKTKKTSKKATITYKKVSGATGYQLQYSTSKKFTAKATKTKKVVTTTVKLSKLSTKKTYYVRVRAYKKVNGKTYYGQWSSKKKITVKK